MPSGLEAASVFATFGVKTSAWTKGLKRMADDTVKFLKSVEEVGSKIGQFGAVIAAGIGGAMATAAKANAGMAADLERIKKLLFTFGVEIGEMFAPALKEMSANLERALAWFQGLNPEVKAALGHFAGVAATVGTAALAIGKFSGVLSAVVKGATLLGGALTSPFFLGAAAAVGAFILIYDAWTETGSGLQAGVEDIWLTFKGYFDAVGGEFKKLGGWLLDYWAFVIRNLSKLLAPIADLVGDDTIAGVLREMQNMTGDSLLKDLTLGAGIMVDGAKKAGAEIGKRLERGFEKLQARAAGLLGGVSAGGGKARLREESDPMAIFGGAAPAATSMKTDFAAILALGRQEFSLMPAYFEGVKREAKDAAEKMARSLEQAAEEAKRATERAQGHLLSMLGGPVNGLISAVTDGLALGGPLGALGMVAAEVMSHSVQFQQLLGMVAGFLQELADVVGAVLVPVLPIVAAAFDMVSPLLQALTPAIASLLSPLESIAPVFEMIALLMVGLGPIIEFVAQAFALYLKAPLMVLEGAIRLMFPVWTKLAAGVLWVAEKIAKVWNAVIGAVRSVFDSLAKIPLIGKHLGKVSDALGSVIIDTEAISDAQNAMKNATYESMLATARESAARRKNTEAMKEFGEELSNIPTGFKVRLGQFNATDGISAPGMYPTRDRGAPPMTNITINMPELPPTASAEQVAQEVVRLTERAQFRREGVRERAAIRTGRD